ncbi:MAG: metal-dependent hydrolase [Hyphomicrobiaceae bacterium]|jgi:L-ascorbate metabolism protein UlaG (beta-lactamase superfamily)|nr:metal-dependent hydrolase [Methyloceanibacter sp.]MDX2317464.1 metal-dependent hydrolase [Hyphomicrobiaceae bacterium]MDX2449484.1 metal-dependent hydrolase [Hyphomicrobiaceae bacterium]
MKITWFGHACFRIDTSASAILIDPFLTGNAVFEKSGIPLSKVTEGVTHVALTHGHEDHVGNTISVCKATGATLIAVYELAMYLASQGVETVDPGNTGGKIPHDDFDLTFVPAWHSSSVIVDGRPLYLGNPCGIVIAPKDGKTVYHMGDTDIFADMGLINELYRPQIGIVPIGDRFTMGAKTASLACKRFFNFETVVPCHYGTFPIVDQTPDQFVTEMGENRVLVPELGVPFEA